MYSIVLFIVETSLSGFFGSGERPTSAVDRIRATKSSGARPVNSTTSPARACRGARPDRRSSRRLPMRVKRCRHAPSRGRLSSAARTTMSTPS